MSDDTAHKTRETMNQSDPHDQLVTDIDHLLNDIDEHLRHVSEIMTDDGRREPPRASAKKRFEANATEVRPDNPASEDQTNADPLTAPVAPVSSMSDERPEESTSSAAAVVAPEGEGDTVEASDEIDGQWMIDDASPAEEKGVRSESSATESEIRGGEVAEIDTPELSIEADADTAEPKPTDPIGDERIDRVASVAAAQSPPGHSAELRSVTDANSPPASAGPENATKSDRVEEEEEQVADAECEAIDSTNEPNAADEVDHDTGVMPPDLDDLDRMLAEAADHVLAGRAHHDDDIDHNAPVSPASGAGDTTGSAAVNDIQLEPDHTSLPETPDDLDAQTETQADDSERTDEPPNSSGDADTPIDETNGEVDDAEGIAAAEACESIEKSPSPLTTIALKARFTVVEMVQLVQGRLESSDPARLKPAWRVLHACVTTTVAVIRALFRFWRRIPCKDRPIHWTIAALDRLNRPWHRLSSDTRFAAMLLTASSAISGLIAVFVALRRVF